MLSHTVRAGVLVLTTLFGYTLAPVLTPAQAQKASIDDKAREVFERALEVQFGEVAKTRSVKAIKMSGIMSIPAQGLNADLELVLGNGQMLLKLNIPGLGEMQEGYTDGQGWAFSELQGPSLKSDSENLQSKEQADLYSTLNWEKYYSSISYEGEQTIQDYHGEPRNAHVLKMVSADGERTNRTYFDAETGHTIQLETEIIIQGGTKVPSVTKMADYRDVGGMKMPFKNSTSFGPIEQLFEFTKAEVNPDLPAGTFEVPGEVKQLMDNG